MKILSRKKGLLPFTLFASLSLNSFLNIFLYIPLASKKNQSNICTRIAIHPNPFKHNLKKN
jgi:hypothetical protein